MKKITIAIVATLLIGAVAFGGIATYVTLSNQKTFQEDGYILTGTSLNKGKIEFAAGTKFTVKNEYVTFKDVDGNTVRVELDCFVHYTSGAVESFVDGVLMNFKDLSDNFINNYFIEANVIISPNEGGIGYVSNTNTEMQFGNFLLKLESGKYIVCAPHMYVHLSDTEQPEIEGFVEVLTSTDGIAYIRTTDNAWTTVMDDFFIQIGEGDSAVKIYPTDGIVRNADYAMSVNKLAVSQDDAIVLSAAETRRQIVPRINVVAENGKNGSDGGDGNNGSDGNKGESGNSGAEGESGVDGTQGSRGEDGTPGGLGSDGLGGNEGSKGTRGGDGGDGTNVIGDSSTNSSIPVMTIKNWDISATGVKGVIAVGGNLEALEVSATTSNSFAGRVTIYNLTSGEAYTVYQCESTYKNIDESGDFTAFAAGSDEVYFTSFSEENDYVPLSPDTGYRLSVVAYYKMNNVIFSREFISRVFYTDSTGVFISTESIGTTSVTVKSSIGDAYYSTMATVEVFLLDSTQNANFSYLNRNAIGNYTQKFTLDYTTNAMSRYYLTYDSNHNPDLNVDQTYNGKHPSQNTSLKFTDLTNNKDYIVRVVISTTEGFNTLSSQTLNVTTLKTTPTWSLPVSANYSQATGALEVYRPGDIFDPDGGITSYIYKAYQADGTFIQSHTIAPSTADPISFYLPSNNTYYFEVIAVFEDNQKTVQYSLGKCDNIATFGATLPRVTLTKNGSTTAIEYNQFSGYLSIDLTNADVSLQIDNNHPLELQIYSDQVYDTTITIKGTNTVKVATSYSATYSNAVSTYARIDLELINLYKNKNYTITVSGYLNLNDGNGVVYRTIGSASFRTYNTTSVTAVYNNSKTTTGSINKMLQLVPYTTDSDRKAYAISQLTQGQVTLTLYSGTGLAKSPMVSTVISDPTSLAKLYGDGYDITEADFGNLTLNTSQDYTIGVTAISDQTSKMKLGYVNDIDTINNATLPITAQATPPDLPTVPTSAIRVIPIYNNISYLYGVEARSNLPDDAVVGYALEAQYDNVQRLGDTITYYAMEYAQFYNALLNKTDPVGKDGYGVSKLITMTQSFGASDKPPYVAVFFGGDKQSTDEDAREAYYGGYYVYWAGSIDYSMTTGMDRGYRYVFAYTAKYSTDGTFDALTMGTYPYDHPRYNGTKYKYYLTYGAGYQNGVLLGSGVAYILNSGMIEAPKIEPEIHSYVYDVTGTTAGTSLQYSYGTITLHYRFRDIDNTIVTTGALANRTQIQYEEQSVPINATGTGSYDWYTATFNYTMEFGQGSIMFEPTLNISTYLYNYNTILQQLGYTDEEIGTGFYMCHVPIEPDYAFLFASNTYKNAFKIKILTDYLDENYFVFLVEGLNGAQDLDLLAERCYQIKLSFVAPASTNGLIPEVDIGTYYFNTTLGYIGANSEYGLYCKVSSGLFANVLKRNIKCTASLMIDNGNQGVKLMEESEFFGLQYINTLKDGFGFDNYVSAVSGGSSMSPNGGLLSINPSSPLKDSDTLEATLANLNAQKKISTRFNYKANLSATSYYKYFFVDHYGIDAAETSDIEKLSGRYLTFKGVTEIPLKFDGTNVTKITSMTPVIQSGGHVTSTSQLMIRKSLTVSGADKGQLIYLAVYDTQDHAIQLSGDPIALKSFLLDDNGHIALTEEEDYLILTVPNPSSTQKYFYTFYTIINGKPTVLINYSTSTKFVQQFQLISNVLVESQSGLIYYNEGYLDKHADMIFTLSAYVGFELRYDLFNTQEDAEAGVNAIYTEADVIMNDPIPSAQNNRFWINLEPSAERNKIVPGGHYVLRIRVIEKASGFQVGCNYFPLNIAATSNSGAVVYTDNATSTSITFKATLFDPSYVFMSPATTDQGTKPSLYTVRFEKEDGTRLVTTYDYQLYTGNTLKQTFTLSNDVLTWYGKVAGQEITGGTYVMRIYAVPDYNHDGYSNPISSDINDVKNNEWFFVNKDDGSVDGTNFYNLLDSFWDSSFKNDKTKDSIENGFLIATKKQSTTDDKGFLVDDNNVTATRKGNYLQMVFAESFGFIYEYNGQQAQTFTKIEYYITGTADNGKAINVEGSVTKASGATMFKQSIDSAGYSIYTFQIPDIVPSGSVQIVLKMYKTTNPTEVPTTISKTYRG